MTLRFGRMDYDHNEAQEYELEITRHFQSQARFDAAVSSYAGSATAESR